MRKNVANRIQKHRMGLWALGLCPVQIWVPDTKKSGFSEECRRQSLSLRSDPHEVGMMVWLEAAANTDGWE
jgi:hypothetical protein